MYHQKNVKYVRNDVRVLIRDLHNTDKSKIAIVRSPRLLKHDVCLLLQGYDDVKKEILHLMKNMPDSMYTTVPEKVEPHEDESDDDIDEEKLPQVLSRGYVYDEISQWVFF